MCGFQPLVPTLSLNRFLFRKLTLGLSSKKPMTMDLSELSPSDAAAFATKEFLSVSQIRGGLMNVDTIKSARSPLRRSHVSVD